MELRVGDTVTRMLAGQVAHELVITDLTDAVITCAEWTFCRHTGAEIDELLGWGPPPMMTGSYLVLSSKKANIQS